MDTSLTAALATGLLLGIRHASDADHVAAVTTLVARQGSLVRSALIGTFWGAGHALALLVAGVATIAFELTISPAVERTLETLVALVLILLGGQVVLGALRAVEVHRHPHAHVHLLRVARRPFLVGLLHGLAGSAALMLLVLSTIPSALGGLLYILVFGVGAMLGMLVLTGLVALPLAHTSAQSAWLQTVIRGAAGAASLGLGVWLLRPAL
jgi:hypothetical protein